MDAGRAARSASATGRSSWLRAGPRGRPAAMRRHPGPPEPRGDGVARRRPHGPAGPAECRRPLSVSAPGRVRASGPGLPRAIPSGGALDRRVLGRSTFPQDYDADSWADGVTVDYRTLPGGGR
ncbi:hypothetical protein DEF28_19360, partial [Marinitenerispora sediminis]